MPDNVFDVGLPVASRDITSVAATGLTAADLRTAKGDLSANRVVVTVSTNVVRCRFDGTDPTATVGHLLSVGVPYIFEGVEVLNKLKFIDTAAGAASIHYTTGLKL